MGVGGPIDELVVIDDASTAEADVAAAIEAAWQWVVVGGGSNIVASDEPYEGTVVLMRTRGVEEVAGAPEGRQRIRVQAGESWDALVAQTVARGLAGIEALSGIPGSVGAAPVQNIGAYGQELASVLIAITLVDASTREARRVEAAELELGYRTSALKSGSLRGVVTAIELDLWLPEGDVPRSQPVAYAQLAAALGVELGERVSLADVRRSVLELRASKGMVYSPPDLDTHSCGSFFTNPIVRALHAASLPEDAPRFPLPVSDDDDVPPLVKLSAAWLIEQAGIHRGFALPGSGAAISSKHTLAITNRGTATSRDVIELATYVQVRVLAEFGVELQPEPVWLGIVD